MYALVPMYEPPFRGGNVIECMFCDILGIDEGNGSQAVVLQNFHRTVSALTSRLTLWIIACGRCPQKVKVEQSDIFQPATPHLLLYTSRSQPRVDG